MADSTAQPHAPSSAEQAFLEDLDKKLWNAADRFCSTLHTAVYKHAVLGLTFLKYIHRLAPQGMTGFVLANGSMSSNQSGEGDIRRAFIEADLVDCMVAPSLENN